MIEGIWWLPPLVSLRDDEVVLVPCRQRKGLDEEQEMLLLEQHVRPWLFFSSSNEICRAAVPPGHSRQVDLQV